MTEDGMVGWYHQLQSLHEFEQTPEDSEGQGSLARCSPQGCKESHMTEQLNNNSIYRLSLTVFLSTGFAALKLLQTKTVVRIYYVSVIHCRAWPYQRRGESNSICLNWTYLVLLLDNHGKQKWETS